MSNLTENDGVNKWFIIKYDNKIGGEIHIKTSFKLTKQKTKESGNANAVDPDGNEDENSEDAKSHSSSSCSEHEKNEEQISQ